MTLYPIKIFDGKGNYLRTEQPKFDYEGKTKIKKIFEAHECPRCKEITTNKKYCGLCLEKRKEEKK